MKTLITFSLVALSSNFAVGSSVEKWTGSGTAYSPQGQVLSNYQLSVENTPLSNNVTQSVATVVTASGDTKIISQKITSQASHFKTESNLGQGGGSCFGPELCESYIAGADGMAYATTIVVDNDHQERHLTIVLKDGKALKILRDKVTRIK